MLIFIRNNYFFFWLLVQFKYIYMLIFIVSATTRKNWRKIIQIHLHVNFYRGNPSITYMGVKFKYIYMLIFIGVEPGKGIRKRLFKYIYMLIFIGNWENESRTVSAFKYIYMLIFIKCLYGNQKTRWAYSNTSTC